MFNFDIQSSIDDAILATIALVLIAIWVVRRVRR